MAMAENSFDDLLQQTSSVAVVVVAPSANQPPTSCPSAASAQDATMGSTPESTAQDAPRPTSAVVAIGAAPSPDRPPPSSIGAALAEDAIMPAHDTPQRTIAAVVATPSSDRPSTPSMDSPAELAVHDALRPASADAVIVVAPSPDLLPTTSSGAALSDDGTMVLPARLPAQDQQTSSVAAVVVAPSPDRPPTSSPSAAGAEDATMVLPAAMPAHHTPQQASEGVVVAPSPVGPPTPSPSASSDGVAEVECAICLECRRPEEHDSWVTLQCGHAFHAGACLAGHIREQCLLVEGRVHETLRESFDALGLEAGTRRALLDGGDLVGLHQQGRLRQCPQCRYGPVVNTNCFDMASHDSERGSGTGRTTNKCPNCEFFSTRYEDWNVWKPDDVTAAVLCPLCRSRCEVSNSDRTRILERFATVDGRLEARSQMNLWSGMLHMLCTILRELQLGIAARGNDPDGASSHDAPGGRDQALRLRRHIGSRRRARRATIDEFQFLERLGETPVATKRRAFTPVLEHLEHELLRQGGQAKGRLASMLCSPCFAKCWLLCPGRWRACRCWMEDLLREVLAARPVLEGGDTPPVEGFAETWEHREQLALLLYTVKEGLGREVERKLGKPWRPDDLARRQSGKHLPGHGQLETLRRLVYLRDADVMGMMDWRRSVFRALRMLSTDLEGTAALFGPIASDLVRSLLRKVLEDVV
mmetsp:Transcript_142269/g.454794  ORF Transcript_142269/g.454794 Transcript_142269/m.454794 type:complete len:701 (-) Transcript_142269:140-2242(-)